MIAEATGWDKTTDETGTLIHMEFTCPACGADTEDIVFCRSFVSDDIEADLTCPVCGETITVACFSGQREPVF